MLDSVVTHALRRGVPPSLICCTAVTRIGFVNPDPGLR
jgi:hypothetical protein